jgi:hypothetical protein
MVWRRYQPAEFRKFDVAQCNSQGGSDPAPGA